MIVNKIINANACKIVMKRVNVEKIALLTYLLLISVSYVQPLETTDNQTYGTMDFNLDQTDSTIENIQINPIEPTVNEIITVQADIDDIDTLSEALLFWKYDSFNTTYSNTTMTKEDNIPIAGESFLLTGMGAAIEAVEVNTNWYYGNYTLDNWEISNIDLTLESPNYSKNPLVYYKIQIKNITTNNWEIVAEDGISGGDEVDPGNLAPITFTLNKAVDGISIYAETYENLNPNKAPLLALSFDDLSSAGILHSAAITGIPYLSVVS